MHAKKYEATRQRQRLKVLAKERRLDILKCISKYDLKCAIDFINTLKLMSIHKHMPD